VKTAESRIAFLEKSLAEHQELLSRMSARLAQVVSWTGVEFDHPEAPPGEPYVRGYSLSDPGGVIPEEDFKKKQEEYVYAMTRDRR